MAWPCTSVGPKILSESGVGLNLSIFAKLIDGHEKGPKGGEGGIESAIH